MPDPWSWIANMLGAGEPEQPSAPKSENVVPPKPIEKKIVTKQSKSVGNSDWNALATNLGLEPSNDSPPASVPPFVQRPTLPVQPISQRDRDNQPRRIDRRDEQEQTRSSGYNRPRTTQDRPDESRRDDGPSTSSGNVSRDTTESGARRDDRDGGNNRRGRSQRGRGRRGGSRESLGDVRRDQQRPPVSSRDTFDQGTFSSADDEQQDRDRFVRDESHTDEQNIDQNRGQRHDRDDGSRRTSGTGYRNDTRGYDEKSREGGQITPPLRDDIHARSDRTEYSREGDRDNRELSSQQIESQPRVSEDRDENGQPRRRRRRGRRGGRRRQPRDGQDVRDSRDSSERPEMPGGNDQESHTPARRDDERDSTRVQGNDELPPSGYLSETGRPPSVSRENVSKRMPPRGRRRSGSASQGTRRDTSDSDANRRVRRRVDDDKRRSSSESLARSRRDEFSPVGGYDEDDEGLEFLGVEEDVAERNRSTNARRQDSEMDDLLNETGLGAVHDVPSWIEAIGIVIAGNLDARSKSPRGDDPDRGRPPRRGSR
ncbi:MAG: hypothetical protein D4R77_08895 [Planctomycetaceae bacterium]|nr:MAG: hypothetical protein D4R77_08895 [Planctomycetaceae bacterium]